MNLKKSLLGILTFASLAFQAGAQDVHFSQFGMSPLTINPAFAGLHSGLWRANAVYRTQWAQVTTPFNTIAASIDAPIYKTGSSENFLAGGLNIFSDKSGDGGLLNNSVMGTLAYHLFPGSSNYDGSRFNPKTSLSFGMQAGYAQKSINLSNLYFSDEFRNGAYNPGTTAEILKNRTGKFIANAGLSFGTRIGKRSGIQAGVGVFNINQPQESFAVQDLSKDLGLAMRTTVQLGGEIFLDKSAKLALRPAFVSQFQASASEMIAGTEIAYSVGVTPEQRSTASRVFGGVYSRFGDANIVNLGIETNGFRVGVSRDLTTSTLTGAGANVGSWEFGVSYLRPNPLDAARKIFLPCSRF